MASTADVERRDEEETNEPGAGDDEDTGAQVAPIVKLEEVAVTTGEEEEDVLLDMKAKLYRFDKDGNQWKERGTGNVKLLKHKETGKVRLVMRQAKTLKICANHLVVSTTKMQEHAGNDKSCVWHATDFADGELKEEMFAIRFGSVENCKKFMEVVEEIAESLRKSEEKESEEASSAAGLLEKLTVTESKTEESEIKEASASTEKKGEAKLETEAKAGEASSLA
ncbi:ran-binding protein 1 homolog a [Ananas comosus]|uniref:Ran-binding protein 1 homolog a n=1 Tax=Ananas comosus TaxID=4615 RepID=A0A6P5GRK5_ANACO|nr:ran-binding protein 1 homolog a [Ananas comosus]